MHRRNREKINSTNNIVSCHDHPYTILAMIIIIMIIALGILLLVSNMHVASM